MSGFETDVPVRYSDLDTYGHVNNATVATYCEEARVDYFEAVLPADADLTGTEGATGVVVANLEIDFERPVGPVDAVTVGVEVPSLGESSFPMAYEVRADGAVAATGETTMVAYDRAERRSVPIPSSWREAIAAYEGL
ncbi:MAG: acyl-CoA thioesterase [Haloarculaceae archaeon]